MNEDQGFQATIELGVVIGVTEMDRALDFYCDFMGWELLNEEDDPGQERRISTIRYGNVVIDLVTGFQPEKRQNYRLIWTVEKLEEALEHIRAGGGGVVRHMEYGVFCADPDGNTFLVKVADMEPEQAQELFF